MHKQQGVNEEESLEKWPIQGGKCGMLAGSAESFVFFQYSWMDRRDPVGRIDLMKKGLGGRLKVILDPWLTDPF
jgi:hypothetical protein